MQLAEHFVTLFDSNFLPQGLAMYHSLRSLLPNAFLWVIAMDDATSAKLTEAGFDHLRVIPITELETPELVAVKKDRSIAEYCWTVTPIAPRAVFDADPQIERVTYVDADLYFLRDPSPLLEELEQSGRSVLITEHAYDAEYDMSDLYGRFCVQFMTFKRGASEPIRAWWQERCEEWCFAFFEDGKFGDQKYLDDWTERFPDEVHVLQARGTILAPWNARRFPFSEAIAWHFHGLRLIGPNRVRLYRGYSVPRTVVDNVYRPYVNQLRQEFNSSGLDVVQIKAATFDFWLRWALNALDDLFRFVRTRWLRVGRVERW